MFRFDDREEERIKKDKELLNDIRNMEKPKFKDMVAIMLAQYAIIFPMIFIGLAVFGFILWLMTKFCLA